MRRNNIISNIGNTINKNNNIKIYNHHNNLIDTTKIEADEQFLANKYINENDIVLELGARYGSVSCIVNQKLINKKNQVVIEPDSRVWNALELNCKNNNCEFNIVKGFLSNTKLNLTNLDVCMDGYGSTSVIDNNSNIPSFTMSEIKEKYNIANFTGLIADCEGFLEQFINENITLLDELRIIIYEKDYPNKCNYDYVEKMLNQKRFKCVEVKRQQYVWVKN